MLAIFKQKLLRIPGSENEHKVAFVELFFDLIFVFAITQISHNLANHFNLVGVLETIFLLFAVWWVWIYSAWATNLLDPQKNPTRLLLYALMLIGLVMSMSIPDAFGDRALLFAICYVVSQLGRSLYIALALLYNLPREHSISFLRVMIWFAISGILWIGGALIGGDAIFILWPLALLIDYLGPAFMHYVPGLNNANTSKMVNRQLSGEHLAERCGLFIIITLGEILLLTGSTFADLEWGLTNSISFLTAFISTIAMWWIYFNVGAEAGVRFIAKHPNTLLVGRVVYTYLHMILVAGIILTAFASELVLAHPESQAELKVALSVIGGPALFILGNLLIKRMIFGHFSSSHIIGILLLALLFSTYASFSIFVIAVLVMFILLMIGIWETIVFKAMTSSEEPISIDLV